MKVVEIIEIGNNYLPISLSQAERVHPVVWITLAETEVVDRQTLVFGDVAVCSALAESEVVESLVINIMVGRGSRGRHSPRRAE